MLVYGQVTVTVFEMKNLLNRNGYEINIKYGFLLLKLNDEVHHNSGTCFSCKSIIINK